MKNSFGLVIAALCAIAGIDAYAQDWPTKPIKFIAPFPPSGSVDQVARILANALTPALGQPAVRDKLTQQEMDIVADGPEVLAKFVAGEMNRWGKVVLENGIKPGE